MDQISRIGMDTSKHIFQLHGVSADEVPVLRKKLRRKDMVTFFAKLAPTVIAIEACGASHHWARLLQSLARLRGFEGFSVRHPLPINGLAGKVCTTAGGEGRSRWRCAVVAVVATGA